MTRGQLIEMTVAELEDLARDEELIGFSSLRKAELVSFLQKHFADKAREEAEPTPLPSKPKPTPKAKKRKVPKPAPVDEQVEDAIKLIRGAFDAGEKRVEVPLYKATQVEAVRRRMGKKKLAIAVFGIGKRQAAIG